MKLECPGCHATTEVDDKETLAKLDPRYPSQRVTVECKCGEAQFVLEAKGSPRGNRKTSS